MASKLLLYVSGSHATAALWRGGKLSSYRMFESSETGWADFNQFLQATPSDQVHIMLDVVEEDYRFEMLPHSQGRDRAEMLARKLKQFYRNTPFSTAWFQERDSSKRRDDRFLFAAMTNPDLLHHWLRIISQHQAPLAGIYLLPMVSLALLEKLQIKAPNLLLISQHGNGLRQTFFREQRLRISRLTLLDRDTQESQTSAYAEEIANTRLYLETLKMIQQDERLTIIVLDAAETLNDLAQAITRQHSELQCQRLGRQELATRFGLDTTLLQQHPEALYLQLLGLRQPPANLAPPALTADYQRYQARRALYATSLAVALVTGAWSGVNLYRQAEIEGQTVLLAAETQRENDKYQAVARQFPESPLPSAMLKQAVETAQMVQGKAATPERAYALVSRALEASPNVALKNLGWKAASVPNESNAAASGDMQQSISIEAEIKPFKGDYRAAIANIHSFADRLRQEPAVAEVTIVQLPLNISSVSSLSGNTLDSGTTASSATFKLLVSIKAES